MIPKLYGNPFSRAVRPLWYAEEVGLDLELIKERPQSDLVRTLSPLGQIPVLQDGDLILRDSIVILNYLADKTGQLTFAAGSPDRLELDSRLAFLVTDLEAPLWLWYRRSVATGDLDTAHDLKVQMRDDYARGEKRLLRLMGGSAYLMGDGFTIADIVAGHIGGWASKVGFEPETTQFAEYIERVTNRPALAAARAR